MKLNFHTDAGHGWLAAPRALLASLNLLDKVSPGSYQRGATVYLEEDCDASLLLATLREQGIAYEIKELAQGKDVSPIRSYEHFTVAGPRRALRVGDVVELGPGNVRYQLDYPLGPRRGWHVTRVRDGMPFRMPAKHAARARIVSEI